MKKLLLLFTIVSSLSAFSQDHFSPGFIVNNNGDTLKGWVKEDINSRLSSKIDFKSDQSKEPVAYTSNDIRAFGINGNQFRSLQYLDETDSTQKQNFGKLLVDGYYNLYIIYRSVSEHYFYLTTQDGRNFLLYDDIIANTDVTRKGNYHKVLYDIGLNLPNVDNRAVSIGFTERELAKYVYDCNNIDHKTSNSQLHYVKAKTDWSVIGYVGGITLGTNKSQVTVQLLARFVSPSVTKKASLNIGLTYSRTSTPYANYFAFYPKDDRTLTELVAVPVQLQYNFLTGWFQPYIYTGFSIGHVSQTDNYATGNPTNETRLGFPVLAGAGLELHPTSRLFIRADFRYELILQYPSVGLAYRFK